MKIFFDKQFGKDIRLLLDIVDLLTIGKSSTAISGTIYLYI